MLCFIMARGSVAEAVCYKGRDRRKEGEREGGDGEGREGGKERKERENIHNGP